LKIDALLKDLNISPELLDSVYEYAHVSYDIGRYDFSNILLFYFRQLSRDESRRMSALWGKLAGDILVANWDMASDDVALLRESIDSLGLSDKFVQLQYRTWLAHWSLFIHFAKDKTGSTVMDLFYQDKFLNAIQTGSQHLLRYLAAAVVMNRGRKNALNDLRRVISMESHNYSDTVTDFFKAVYIDHDFDAALEHLKDCGKVFKADYFLSNCFEEFRREASEFYFETYCRVHKMIDIHLIDKILEKTGSEGEQWIVNLIRRSRLDAKVDSHAYRVIMTATFPSLYQRVIDKTKMLSYSTSQLLTAMDRKFVGAQTE